MKMDFGNIPEHYLTDLMASIVFLLNFGEKIFDFLIHIYIILHL